MRNKKSLVGIVLAAALAYGGAPVSATAKVRSYNSGAPRLEIRASPRTGIASPIQPFTWTVFAEIKGPETESYYCPKVTWVVGEDPNAIRATTESDCPPFENRNQVIYNNSEACRPYIKDGELFEPSKTVPSCMPQVRKVYPRLWSNHYTVTIPGRYNVCVELAKSDNLLDKKCINVEPQ